MKKTHFVLVEKELNCSGVPGIPFLFYFYLKKVIKKTQKLLADLSSTVNYVKHNGEHLAKNRAWSNSSNALARGVISM